MKILLVEDESLLADTIITFLQKEGFVCEIAKNYFEAEANVSLFEYDCVLIDIGLPDGNGLHLINQLKKQNTKTGIIIISAKNSLEDKILGLDLGADDYLAKPFHLAELNSRIKSVIRRGNFSGNTEIEFNEITINPEQQEVKVFNQTIVLTKKEYDLLLFFISNINRLLTKESIAEHLWGDHISQADSFDFIYSHIKNLRKKLVEKGCHDYLKTIYGSGYKFMKL